jgi:hypothetical protein
MRSRCLPTALTSITTRSCSRKIRLGVALIAICAVSGCGTQNVRRHPPIPQQATDPLFFRVTYPPGSVWNSPCPRHPLNSFDVQSCEIHSLLGVRRQSNRVIRLIWGALTPGVGRAKFRASEQAWNNYARGICEVRGRLWPAQPNSPAYAGGSEAPVVFATCSVAVARSYLAQLRATYDQVKPR